MCIMGESMSIRGSVFRPNKVKEIVYYTKRDKAKSYAVIGPNTTVRVIRKVKGKPYWDVRIRNVSSTYPDKPKNLFSFRAYVEDWFLVWNLRS